MSAENFVHQLQQRFPQAQHLSEHTAECFPNMIFVCVGLDVDVVVQRIKQVSAQGAVGAVVDDSLVNVLGSYDLPLPYLSVQDLATQRAAIAHHFYNQPSSTLQCVGVTGTNGKTSIAYYIAQLARLVDGRGGYIGTIGSGEVGQLATSAMTTPNPIAIQRLLADAATRKINTLAMEVSSHALAQGRTGLTQFAAAVFSNLSRDHLDYHGTMQAYGDAKRLLFTELSPKVAVINIDDSFGCSLAQELVSSNAGLEVVTVGQQGLWRWQIIEQRLGIESPHGAYQFNLPIVAEFSAINITLALATLSCMGYEWDSLLSQIDLLPNVPGRLEAIHSESQTAPNVVVDFAHTPDALEKVLVALKQTCLGELTCLVGCGGDRDKGKRSQMAEVAVNYADHVWFTSDNPRSEAAGDIIQDMVAGLSQEELSRCNIEEDRKHAIKQAIASANRGDVVLLAGKGHETTQEVNGKKYAFDDRQVAAQVLKEVA